MGLLSILDVSAAGLAVEQKRLEVAATNLANARTTGADGAHYQPMTVVAHSAPLSSASGPESAVKQPVVAEVVPLASSPHRVYEPGHPDADKDGYVTLPGVDTVSSMLELSASSRGYEANLRAFDMARSMLQRLLSLGGR